MRKLSKIVSVVLSLALCLGMASPAFAASFQDLQNAIDGRSGGTEFTAEDGSTRYGYAENTDAEGNHVSWGIEAWDGSRNVLDEQGNETGETTSTRHVQLNESVEASKKYNDPVSIAGNGKDVTIDLNGNDIDGKNQGSSVITVKDGGKLTLEDKSDGGSGKITGGTGSTGVTSYKDSGGGVYVAGEGSSFVMNGGNITGNDVSSNLGHIGGGVAVTNGASFTMNGGAITKNEAYFGGGVMVYGGSTFILNKGEIADNHANIGGGVATNEGTFIMHGGAINNNSATADTNSDSFKSGGGVSLTDGSFTMDGGSISNNTAGVGGGIDGLEAGEVEITGGCIYNNTETGEIGGAAAYTINWIKETTGAEFDPADTLKFLADNGYVVNELHHEFGEWVDNGDGTYTRTCSGCGSQENDGTPITPTPDDSTGDNGSTGSAGDTGDTGDISDIGDIGDTGSDDSFIPADVSPVTIADQEVPLAGLVSRQILISYLYVQAGSPDGEDAEGEYAKALAWAVTNGIIDAESDPEEVVTVAVLRDVMARYAKFLDVIFDVEIPGEDDEIIMNCNEILEKFFAAQEDKAA